MDDHARQAVYGDLKRQIKNLEGALEYNDLRGVYGMMYANLRLLLKGLYQDMEHEWVFNKDLIKHFDTWLELRREQLPMFVHIQGLSGVIKTLDEYDAKTLDAVERLRDKHRSLSQGEKPKLIEYPLVRIPQPQSAKEPPPEPYSQYLKDYNALEMRLEDGYEWADKVSFRLLKDGKSTPWIWLNQMEAGFLYYLALERKNNETSWLSNPADHITVLRMINNRFNFPEVFDSEIERASELVDKKQECNIVSHETWIHDHRNRIRKNIVKRIHNELDKIDFERRLIRPVPRAHRSRRGVYQLNKCITDVVFSSS